MSKCTRLLMDAILNILGTTLVIVLISDDFFLFVFVS